ncbi:hypothetical protein JCM10207_002259 [Rhodosporidiobolus poonsookiae]
MSTATHQCAVCGKPSTTRCGPCGAAGLDLYFCSRGHQKLIWWTHKRVCGPRAVPFQHPLLTREEHDALLNVRKNKIIGTSFKGTVSLEMLLEDQQVPRADLPTLLEKCTQPGLDPAVAFDWPRHFLPLLRGFHLRIKGQNGSPSTPDEIWDDIGMRHSDLVAAAMRSGSPEISALYGVLESKPITAFWHQLLIFLTLMKRVTTLSIEELTRDGEVYAGMTRLLGEKVEGVEKELPEFGRVLRRVIRDEWQFLPA